MRGARTTGLFAAFLGLVCLSAVRCAYAPDFPSGTLQCSTGAHSCPEGYVCVSSSNTCYKKSEAAGGTGGGAAGTGVAGAGGAAGGGGHGGAAGGGAGGAGGVKGPPCAGTCTIKIDATLMNSLAPSPDSKFVGHWVYETGSMITVACSDGSTQNTDPAGDFVDITVTSGNLNGSYYCDWNLAVGPAGNATIIKPGQSCSRNMTDMKTGVTHFTWHGTTFTFKTDDSKTGTLTSMIAVEYIDDPAKTGCSL